MRLLKLTIFSLWMAAQTVVWSAYAETCVGGGSLAITTLPSGLTFPTVAVSLTDVIRNVGFTESLEFQDMRGELLGFSLTLKNTDFMEFDTSENITFDLTNLKVASDDNDTIGEIECDDTTGLTLSHLTHSPFADANDDGISNMKALVTGDVRERLGKYSIEPVFRLTIPGQTSAASYRSTLTFTIS